LARSLPMIAGKQGKIAVSVETARAALDAFE
jgi:hypothetical protein